jgi:hypothetical protein
MGAGLVAVGLVAWGLVSSGSGSKPAPAAPALPAAAPKVTPPAGIPTLVSEQGLEAADGVRLLYVAISGDGGLVDMRYQVIDPDKATKLHSNNATTELVDETSGVVVDNPFMGHTHSGTPHAGQTEFILFENPGNLVQTGSKVTVVLGNVRVAHVPVQ